MLKTKTNQMIELDKPKYVSNLKIICFKMSNLSLIQIDDLINIDFYHSRSEIIRIAITLELEEYNIFDGEPESITNFFTNPIFIVDNKVSMSCKLPIFFIKQIDKVVDLGYYPSRSSFLRTAVEKFIVKRFSFHEYIDLPMIKELSENKHNKVIAFKLQGSSVIEIQLLMKNKLFASLSEFLRIAITNYLINEHFIDDKPLKKSLGLNITEQDILELVHRDKNKISACTKIPMRLLSNIDSIIRINSEIYKNRTNLVRISTELLLMEYRKIGIIG